MPKPSAASVPAFKLYGEASSWPTPDLMHCESIAERSRLHNWEIKPHRHVDLVQMLYVQRGSALLKVEDMVVKADTPVLQIVPAMSIHTFIFSKDIQGYILTFAQPLMQTVSTALDGQDFFKAGCLEVGLDAGHLDMLFDLISTEYRLGGSGRELALHSLINLLMVWVTRKVAVMTKGSSQSHERGLDHLQAFVFLLERHYREHWPISQYAFSMGLSANHLNSICRRISGQSALQMINERLMLEAKRCLIYTEMTINEVSDSLGFSEPAYFSRFFKSRCGTSPKGFRSLR